MAGDEVVEGCPVVHLSDTAEDVQYVLGALYNGRLAEISYLRLPQLSSRCPEITAWTRNFNHSPY